LSEILPQDWESALFRCLPLMIQIAYKQSAVTSGWIIAPMALTAMFGKSYVIKIRPFGYRQTLMTNTFIIGTLICLLAIPDINTLHYIGLFLSFPF
jgi:hypothetical protein